MVLPEPDAWDDCYDVREELDDLDRAESTATADTSALVPILGWVPRGEHEAWYPFGQRALSYCMTYVDLGALTDLDLTIALAISQYGVTAKDISPTALDTLSTVRRRILVLLAARQTAVPAALPAGTEPEKPKLGPMAPVLDRPLVRPPSGQKAEVQF